MLYRFARFVTYLFVRLIFRMRYEGLDNIPQAGGFIVCSNHRSNFDPIFLCHKIPQRLRFMAKEELFRFPLAGAFLRGVGAFPIARGKGDTGAIDTAADIIRRGGALVIFPEGHRSKNGKPLRPRSGLAVIASRTGGGALPVSIDYGERLRLRTTVTLRFHPLITNAALGLGEASPAAIRAASKQVMDVIVSGLSYRGKDVAI